MSDAKAKAGATSHEVGELVDLLKAYLLQETVTPLKRIGRELAFGAAAAIMFAAAAILSLVALLRALQGETGTLFAGEWSWVPYLLTSVAGCIFLGLAAARLLKSPKKAGA